MAMRFKKKNKLYLSSGAKSMKHPNNVNFTYNFILLVITKQKFLVIVLVPTCTLLTKCSKTTQLQLKISKNTNASITIATCQYLNSL